MITTYVEMRVIAWQLKVWVSGALDRYIDIVRYIDTSYLITIQFTCGTAHFSGIIPRLSFKESNSFALNSITWQVFIQAYSSYLKEKFSFNEVWNKRINYLKKFGKMFKIVREISFLELKLSDIPTLE